ncbi:hypothetical protein [Streptomyces subrutilus]|uniref:hypothetical protein n=1 Tax=Streptomyces subrutilus TaxID=36818 RepID=UPI0033FCEC5D
MDQRTVPAPRDFAEVWTGGTRMPDTPIYDALERQWLQEGRMVPGADGSARWVRRRPEGRDLFERG